MEKISIEFNQKEPKYLQLKSYIQNQVVGGVWETGSKLPSEEILMKQLDVSRGTIRKAFDLLIEDGVVERIHGVGTFVKSAKITYPFAQELVSFEEAMNKKKISFETEVIKFTKILPNKNIQKRLNISKDEEVFYIERRRKVDDKTVIVLFNWVTSERASGLENEDLEQQGLFTSLEKVMNQKIKYGSRKFTAELVDKKLAKLMDLPEKSPVLKIEQITFREDNSPIETSDVFLDSSEYPIESTLFR